MSSRTRRCSLSTFALTLLVTLQAETPVWAWGTLGHRVTARIAEKHLNPNAKDAIEALLDEGETPADASTWADQNCLGESSTAKNGAHPLFTHPVAR